jgi:VWFA-related protein
MNQVASSLAVLSLALNSGLAGTPVPAAPATQSAEAQVRITQVDTSHFPQITVYVSVTDAAGEPLGIDPARISLTENGQTLAAQPVNGQGAVGPLTTLLVIDTSGSMNEGGKLAAAKAAAKTYVDQMRPGDQAGLMTFNTQVALAQPITADRAALAQAIAGLKARNDTAMYDALAQAAKLLQPVPGRKAVIALTDGLDNRSAVKPEAITQLIGPSGLSISTIGLGDPTQLGITNAGLNETVLRSLAGESGGSFGYANDPGSLTSLYERYGRALQSEYVFAYTDASALRDGVTRSLAVGLNGGAGPDAVPPAAATTAYNPGGLVPEVSGASWPLFGLLLAALLALLALPMLAGRGLALARAAAGRRARKSRIRLSDPPPGPRIRMP